MLIIDNDYHFIFVLFMAFREIFTFSSNEQPRIVTSAILYYGCVIKTKDYDWWCGLKHNLRMTTRAFVSCLCIVATLCYYHQMITDNHVKSCALD